MECHGPVKVLLVSEQFSDYAAWSALIEVLGHHELQLNWCSQYSQAPRSMLGDSYDIVFLDCYSDPTLSRRLLANTLSQGCQTPIVVLCQPDNTDQRDQSMAAGASDYIFQDKLEAELLSRVIRYQLGRRASSALSNRYVNFDALTGLPNRLIFVDRLEQALQRVENGAGQLGLLYLDIDGFQEINNVFGQDAGNGLLCDIASRLEQSFAAVDTIARLGGDEFAILLEVPKPRVRGVSSAITKACQKVGNIFAKPFLLTDKQIVVGASVGVAICPEAGRQVDALLRSASFAADLAKESLGFSYRFYNEDLDIQTESQLVLESELRCGIASDEFRLFYQPRIDLDSGKIVGVEALIRWQHPTRGLVKPDDFIPLAETSGLIEQLGYWVVHQACDDIRRLDAVGLSAIDVAVNLSFQQFQDVHFVETIAQILAHAEVAPGRIEFELTETAIMDDQDATRRCMSALAKLGSSFSLDDFGTGYSSFAHIQRLPISALKIDRSFIQYVTEREEDANIVRAIVSLAHSLKMIVVAEGAEDIKQVEFLHGIACDQVQGFYFSPAVSFDVLCQLIDEDMQIVVPQAVS